jgi:hypothetical protein
VAFAELLADAIDGRPAHEVLAPRDGPYAGRIAAITAGSWRGKARAEIRGSGYVAHSLEAALWCVGRSDSFAEAVLLAANLGEMPIRLRRSPASWQARSMASMASWGIGANGLRWVVASRRWASRCSIGVWGFDGDSFASAMS